MMIVADNSKALQPFEESQVCLVRLTRGVTILESHEGLCAVLHATCSLGCRANEQPGRPLLYALSRVW